MVARTLGARLRCGTTHKREQEARGQRRRVATRRRRHCSVQANFKGRAACSPLCWEQGWKREPCGHLLPSIVAGAAASTSTRPWPGARDCSCCRERVHSHLSATASTAAGPGEGRPGQAEGRRQVTPEGRTLSQSSAHATWSETLQEPPNESEPAGRAGNVLCERLSNARASGGYAGQGRSRGSSAVHSAWTLRR